VTTATISERIWLDVHQAAERAGYHWRYIADLCRSGEIHGTQRKRGGKWRIHVECLDAWAGGVTCAHQKAGTG
jgi:excisionase family DNA binding protein